MGLMVNKELNSPLDAGNQMDLSEYLGVRKPSGGKKSKKKRSNKKKSNKKKNKSMKRRKEK
jgi:hypothetical protein